VKNYASAIFEVFLADVWWYDLPAVNTETLEK